jgi:hypothetical protein
MGEGPRVDVDHVVAASEDLAVADREGVAADHAITRTVLAAAQERAVGGAPPAISYTFAEVHTSVPSAG